MTSTQVELAVRAALREDPALLSLLSNDTRKIDLDDNDLGKTFVTLFRAGGAPSSRINYDEPAISFHCWGASWNGASKLAVAVCNAINSLHAYYYETTYISTCEVTSCYDSPPPEDPSQHRFVVTALVRAKRAG